MKPVLLLVCFVSAITAQVKTTKHWKLAGSAQFETTGDSVTIRYREGDWRVDLSALPIRPEECAESEARETCATHPGLGCLQCVREWQPIAWDEPREVFYFGASLGTGHNRPWIILSYALRTGKLTRIVAHDGGGFDSNSVVSPSGTYLAFVGYGVCGVCCTTSALIVVDTQARKSAQLPPQTVDGGDETAKLTGLRWIGASTLEYNGEIHRESECIAGIDKPSRLIAGKLEVTEILNSH
jgi:hypothetical protein